MGETIKGYENTETIRLFVGSPGTNFAFSQRMDTVLIDNLGSPNVYVDLNGGTVTPGSTIPLIKANSFRSFDIRTGSVGILSTTTGSVEVQVIGGTNI